MRQFYQLFAVLFLTALLKAQQPVLKNFSTKNGLPSNETYFLHHDQKGYIWICSDGGIVKYNGHTFKTFTSAEGLPDNTVFEVKEDKNGRLWYRTFSGKLGFIENDTVHAINANSRISDFVKDGIVSSFAIEDDGTLYIGKRNTEKVSFLKITPPYSAAQTTEIWTEDQVGIHLILLKKDIVFTENMSRRAQKYYEVKMYDPDHALIMKDSFDLNAKSVFCRVYRDKNNVYLLADEHLKLIDPVHRTSVYRKFETPLVTIVRVDEKNLLVGGRFNGINHLQQEGKNSDFNGLLKGLTFTYAVKDYQDGYWLSTLENGVFYMPDQKMKFFIPLEEDKAVITGMEVINDTTLLIGYINGKVIKTIVGIGPVRSEEIIRNEKLLQRLTLIHPLNSASVILSGLGGSYTYDLSKGTIRRVLKHTNSTLAFKRILNVRDSLICFGNSDIYAALKTDPEFILGYHRNAMRMSCAVYNHFENKVFIGGLKGFYEYRFRALTEKDKLLDIRVEDLAFDETTTYLATNANGVILRRNGKWDTINQTSGIISNICKSLTLWKNTLWVTTPKGISKIIFYPNQHYEIYNYPLGNFIEASAAGKIYLLKGKACFYSANKLFIFDATINPGKERLYLKSFNVNGRNYSFTQPITFPYYKSDVTITFEALLYNVNNTIQYRYKIHKNDSNWNYTEETSLKFPSLSPGKYEFIVQARNNQGKWISAPEKIVFTIDRRFWLKTWFISLEILLGASIALLILRYRYRRLIKKERERTALKISMYELETRAVKAQMNPHFIFNSLNSIQQFILGGENENAYRYLTKFSKLVRRLLESNTSDSISLEEEIDLLKRYVEIEALRFESVFKYEFIIDEKLNLTGIRIPHMLIQPFIENAIWHGLLHKTGEKILTVSFSYFTENCLTCIVEDNGVGRDLKKQEAVALNNKRSLALEFIKQRLDLIRKMKNVYCGFEITDKKDKEGNSLGTYVKIILPILENK